MKRNGRFIFPFTLSLFIKLFLAGSFPALPNSASPDPMKLVIVVPFYFKDAVTCVNVGILFGVATFKPPIIITEVAGVIL